MQLFLCRLSDVFTEYAAAYKLLKHALSLPPQTNRPLWDKNRRAVIHELMTKAEASAARG